jgi:hypothetical protein
MSASDASVAQPGVRVTTSRMVKRPVLPILATVDQFKSQMVRSTRWK